MLDMRDASERMLDEVRRGRKSCRWQLSIERDKGRIYR
jgi:hypothetical protein